MSRRIFFQKQTFMAIVNLPPPNIPPPRNKAGYYGLINHWFPLIRPAIKPLFLGGVPWGGRLTIAMKPAKIKRSCSSVFCDDFHVVSPFLGDLKEPTSKNGHSSTWRIIPGLVSG